MNTYNVGETPLNADTAREFAESYPSDGGYIEAVGSAIRSALTELDPPKPLEVGMMLSLQREILYVNHEAAVTKNGAGFTREGDPAGLTVVENGTYTLHPWPDPPVDEQKERYLEALKQIAESATWTSMLKAEEVRRIIRKALEADK